jgi:riboflavin synthase alpha subunit
MGAPVTIATGALDLSVVAIIDDSFMVTLYPHTVEVTNLIVVGPSSRVNLEADWVARCVDRLRSASR